MRCIQDARVAAPVGVNNQANAAPFSNGAGIIFTDVYQIFIISSPYFLRRRQV